MKAYFTLSPECVLVKGASRGAIYDLKSGNVFSIDGTSVKILDQLNSGKNLQQVLNGNNVNKEKLVVYLNGLDNRGMGNWSENYNKTAIVSPNSNAILRYVLHLELTTGCNLHCLHCYNESEISKLYGGDEVPVNDWQKAISEAYQIGCRRIQLIGGEPFLKRNLVYELIPFARDMGYTSIEVSTNGTLMTKEDLEFLWLCEASIVFSFYSYKSQVHDSITNRSGSWEKTLAVIKKSLNVGLAIRTNIVVMKQNEKDVSETAEFLKSLGVKYIKIDSVQAAGRGCSDIITDGVINRQIFDKAVFAKTAPNTFWRNKAGHNCFSEQICIGANGNVYPCLAERKISYGNIREKSLTEIFFSEKAKHFKGLSKDNIDICRDCEYRYCCFDCRVRAADFLEGDFRLKPWWCSYNPYKGKWENKKS